MIEGYHGALGDTSIHMTIFYYDRASNLYRFGRRWGSATVYDFDGIGRPSSIVNAFANPASDTVSTFGYNPASQITSESRTNDSYAWTGSVAVSRPYSVNGQNQYTAAGPCLKRAERVRGGGAAGREGASFLRERRCCRLRAALVVVRATAESRHGREI